MDQGIIASFKVYYLWSTFAECVWAMFCALQSAQGFTGSMHNVAQAKKKAIAAISRQQQMKIDKNVELLNSHGEELMNG